MANQRSSFQPNLAGESGSALIETVFWLLVIQVPLFLAALGLSSAQHQLARAETLLREAARATLLSLENAAEPTTRPRLEAAFESHLRILESTTKTAISQGQFWLDCIPAPDCEYVRFQYKAGAEAWQPQITLLFSNSRVQP